MSIVDVILADPAHWLWDTETQVELFRLFPTLWRDSEEHDRTRLVAAIEAGPPREMFDPEIDDAEWNELREHLIWSRLVRIAGANPPLSEHSQTLLRDISQRHPQWRLTGDPNQDFPTWVEVRWGSPSSHTTEQLTGLADDALLQLLNEETRQREGLIDRWSKLVAADPVRGATLLERLSAEGQFRRDVWSGAVRGLRSTGGKAAIRGRLLAVFVNAPDELLRDAIHEVADLVNELASEVPDALRADVLSLWDRLLPLSLEVAATLEGDRVTAAINHPTGKLTEAIFAILRSRELQRAQGIDEDVRVRLERILGIAGDAARLGRVVIASRLPLLHDLAQQWTNDNVIHLFDWQHPEEATGAWQGFLWSPVISPALWTALKPHFLATFDHLAEMDEGIRSLPTLLASIAIDGVGALTHAEARECLRKLDESGRSEVAWVVEKKLEDAGAQSSVLWSERIGPWLAAAWPREPALRSDNASLHLAEAAARAGDAFPDAVAVVSDLVGPITRAWGLLRRLREHGRLASHPLQALQLVSLITPNDPTHWFGNLRRFLEGVRVADPALAATPQFIRLNDIALVRGLDRGDDD
jgi:hypothetical protein